MTEEEKSQHKEDYLTLQALFIALLHSLHSQNEEAALYDLMEMRLDIAFKNVIEGLGIDYSSAISLIRSDNDENLTQYERDLRDRIEAALLNLIDFCVCEEYQLYEEVLERVGDKKIDTDNEDYEYLLTLCEKYNDKYAAVENADIRYSGMMAAMWLKLSAADYLVYWTQNDTKVRPWHMELQGYAAPRDEFPSWMIPPIEYNCRCFLGILEVPYAKSSLSNIKGSAKHLQKPQQLSDIYAESLAKCGRIFGPSHPYFEINKNGIDMLNGFVNQLISKYHGER